MILLLVQFGVVALIWGLIAARKLSLSVSAFGLLIIGSCFGHAFFNQSVGPLPLTLDRILWLGLMLLFVVAVATGRLRLGSWSHADTLVVSFLGLVSCNLLLSQWRLDGFQPLATFLFFVLMPAGCYWLTRHASFDERSLRILTIGSIGFAVYLALTAIAEDRGWTFAVFPRYISDPSHEEFFGRGRGPFLNPVAMGIAQLFCLSFSVSNWSQFGKVGKVGLALLMVLVFAGCYSTLTRSVWLSVALGMGLLLVLQLRLRGRILCFTAATLAVLLFAGGAYDYAKSFKRDENVSVAEMEESAKLRPLLGIVALRMAVDRPAMGHGFGQYEEHSKQFHFNHDGGEPLQKVLPYVQHNVFLSVLVDLGVSGLILFGGLLLYWARASVKLWQASRPGTIDWRLAQVGMVLWIAYVLNGLFHDVLIIPMMNMFFFTCFGLIVKRYELSKRVSISSDISRVVFRSQESQTTLGLSGHESQVAANR